MKGAATSSAKASTSIDIHSGATFLETAVETNSTKNQKGVSNQYGKNSLNGSDEKRWIVLSKMFSDNCEGPERTDEFQ